MHISTLKEVFMKKKLMLLGLMLCFCISIVPVIKTQAAKKNTIKKAVINKKTASVTVKKKITLLVKNPTRKVNWKSSNPKIAIVKSTSGVKRSKAVIQGKKKGNCTITAKIGNRKLTCKLKVKAVVSTKNPSYIPSSAVTQGAIGVYVTNVVATRNAISITVKYFNGSKDDKEYACFGNSFFLEKWTNGQWETIETKEPMIINLLAIMFPGQRESSDFTYKLEEPKEDLTTGQYRIHTTLSTDGTTPCIPYAEFYLNLD